MSAWPVAEEAFGGLNPFTVEGKAQLVINQQDMNCVKFSLTLCDFWAVNYDTMSQIMSCILDRSVSVGELKIAGERIWNLLRMFNIREGFKMVDDSLPKRFFDEDLKSGHTANRILPRDQFDIMLKEYYQIRGWNELGIPTKERLAKLEVWESGV